MLCDTKKSETPPRWYQSKEVMDEASLSLMREPKHNRHYSQMGIKIPRYACPFQRRQVPVIGENGLIFDKPGFEVSFLLSNSIKERWDQIGTMY